MCQRPLRGQLAIFLRILARAASVSAAAVGAQPQAHGCSRARGTRVACDGAMHYHRGRQRNGDCHGPTLAGRDSGAAALLDAGVGGAAVTVWGKNLGASRGSSTLTVNDATLASDADYAEWGAVGPARGLERITFWLNSSCADADGGSAADAGSTADAGNASPAGCSCAGGVRAAASLPLAWLPLGLGWRR